MIDVGLPPIERGPQNFNETVEAFAMCYLSAYSSGTVQTRPLQSYQRAWGFDNLKLWPRVPGGRPGWTLTFYTSGARTHIILAIEGMTSINQLIAAGATLNANQVGSLPGRVVSIFDDYATAILATLLADADFIAATDHRRYTMTITGFSMGAAVAEVLAAKLMAGDPTRQIKLIKFASPRVGNQNWLEGYDQRIDKSSWYTPLDPIHTYPQTLFSRGAFPLATLQVYTFLERDPYPRILSQTGAVSDSLVTLSTLDANLALVDLTREMNTGNRWYTHQLVAYRYFMQFRLANNGRFLNYYRFAYLEHNDENSWQVNFQPGGGINANMALVLAPAPDAQVVPPEMFQRIQEIYVADTTTGGFGGGGDGDNMEGETQSAGAWGYSPPTRRIRHGAVVR